MKKLMNKTDNLGIVLLLLFVEGLIEKIIWPAKAVQKKYYKLVIAAQKAQQ